MADRDLDLLGDPIPEGHGERGRPPHLATEKNRSKIMLLLAEGWTQTRIANALSITVKTLRKHYSRELRARDQALDRLKGGHRSMLWEEGRKGNVAALKEIGKIILGIDAGRFGQASADRDDDDEAPIPRLGKKDEANLAAKTAGEGSGWGGDLQQPPHSKMN